MEKIVLSFSFKSKYETKEEEEKEKSKRKKQNLLEDLLLFKADWLISSKSN